MLTSSYLLEIATKAPQLFQSSKAALKSKLLRFLLSNLVINDKKLVFNLKAPFDVIAECSQNQSWLPLLDTLRNNSELVQNFIGL
jgi:chaperone required for assembly of F1-ATPase